jgi:hypothetical protein
MDKISQQHRTFLVPFDQKLRKKKKFKKLLTGNGTKLEGPMSQNFLSSLALLGPML